MIKLYQRPHDLPRILHALNRLLSPPHMRDAFEAYITHSLIEEMGRIIAYYGERGGGFWVAAEAEKVVGMFGLETASSDALELRRMYVAPSARRTGVAQTMLSFAEEECRRRKMRRLELSTSELQPAALELYRSAGYRMLQEVIATETNNKILVTTIAEARHRVTPNKGLIRGVLV